MEAPTRKDAAIAREVFREEFGANYLPLVRGYLRHRWGGWPIAREIDDAVQDVFMECFRADGVLQSAKQDQGSFQAYLQATTRNVARRYEERVGTRRDRSQAESTFLREQVSREASLSVYFDRSWAQEMMSQAGVSMKRRAGELGEDALRRYELLQLRFQEDVPIREVAKRWGVPDRQVHDAYATARREFYRCLREVVALHGAAAHALDAECEKLIELLG